jgi:OHCU decarboxylase
MSIVAARPAAPSTQDVHPVDKVLPFGQLFAFGLQHVLAMYAGAVAVPLIVSFAIGLKQDQLIYLINADLFTCGVATVIQTLGLWRTPVGIKLPIMQGCTFAAVTPMILIGKAHGLTTIYGSIIIAGLITVILSPFFSRLLRFFPPVVTGTIITIIGISLLPVAVSWAAGGNPSSPDYGNVGFIAIAFVVLALTLFIYRFFRGFISNIAVLLGLILGTLIAVPFGLADFSSVGTSAWAGITTPFHYGLPTFDLASTASMTLVMLVTMVETTGDIIAVGEIVDKPITPQGLARGLRADGLSTMLGGILNAFPYTAFAQNVGLVGVTGVRSRFVVTMAGVILIVLGLLPKLAAVVASIPQPVLGGAGLVLFGMVAASGIKTLTKIKFTGNHNLMVIAVSIGVGLIPLGVPGFYQKFPDWVQIILNSGITAGSITAIVLNILFNGVEKAIATEAPGSHAYVEPEKISLGEVNLLSEKEFVEKFGRLFQGGDWIAAEAWQKHPFHSIYELRHAFQDAVFNASPERQLALIQSYPNLGRMITSAQDTSGAASSASASDGVLGPVSLRDQSAAGLHQLSPEEYKEFSALSTAYRDKFGFPLVICVRENTKETILASGKNRLENSPTHEKTTALVEIAKIANLRLQDLVAASVFEGAAS